VTSATSAADAARARYREGVARLLELLTAENVLASAAFAANPVAGEWHTSLVQLAHGRRTFSAPAERAGQRRITGGGHKTTPRLLAT